VTETLEHTARQIAERGRDELVARLRPAFQEAATAHADVLELKPEQLEQMVQRAADRADGLQWRRALASVASQRLGIGIGEALSHPAVARAHAIVGAPSYEESLEKLKAAAATAPAKQTREARTEPGARAEQPPAQAPEQSRSEPEPPESELEEATVEAGATGQGERLEEPEEEDDTLRIAAVHLGGIANLTSAEAGIELRLAPEGLDIARNETEVLGRLAWEDITELEVPPSRGLRRKRRSETHLVVRTTHGDASFQIPGLDADELRAHLTPMVKRYKR